MTWLAAIEAAIIVALAIGMWMMRASWNEDNKANDARYDEERFRSEALARDLAKVRREKHESEQNLSDSIVTLHHEIELKEEVIEDLRSEKDRLIARMQMPVHNFD